MTTWTSQMGFPLIHVDSRIEPGKKILTLTQEKFNADGRYEKIVSYMQSKSLTVLALFLTTKNALGVLGITFGWLRIFQKFNIASITEDEISRNPLQITCIIY